MEVHRINEFGLVNIADAKCIAKKVYKDGRILSLFYFNKGYENMFLMVLTDAFGNQLYEEVPVITVDVTEGLPVKLGNATILDTSEIDNIFKR